jgi:hypothetical protein
LSKTGTHVAGEKRQHHGVIHESKSRVRCVTGIFRWESAWQGAQIKVLHGETVAVSQQLELLNGLKVGPSQFPTFLK